MVRPKRKFEKAEKKITVYKNTRGNVLHGTVFTSPPYDRLNECDQNAAASSSRLFAVGYWVEMEFAFAVEGKAEVVYAGR